jgi:hypothetical protein
VVDLPEVVPDVGLENGLKHDPRGLLKNPVLHGRDSGIKLHLLQP